MSVQYLKGGKLYIELKKAREKQGFSQKQVAKLAQITERGYQNYELGIRKPNVDTAIRIAQVLKSDVETLFKL